MTSITDVVMSYVYPRGYYMIFLAFGLITDAHPLACVPRLCLYRMA